MLRLLKLLFVVPLAVLALSLAFFNRGWIKLIYWPDVLGGERAIEIPQFAALIAMMMVGVLVGGVAVWLAQSSHRRAERRYKQEADKLKAEAARLQAAQPANPYTLPALKTR